MKKEFKAPIVETKEFMAECVMGEIAILDFSTGPARGAVVLDDSASVVDGYKQWKGLK